MRSIDPGRTPGNVLTDTHPPAVVPTAGERLRHNVNPTGTRRGWHRAGGPPGPEANCAPLFGRTRERADSGHAR